MNQKSISDDKKIRKADPVFDKLNVTRISNYNKVEGIRENSNKPTNINQKKIKRHKKSFTLQDFDDPGSPQPGPSSRTD